MVFTGNASSSTTGSFSSLSASSDTTATAAAGAATNSEVDSLPPPPPSASVQPLKKHSMKEQCFLRPSRCRCDVCGGVLFGNGFQCMGPCGKKCHRGLGLGTLHCHAQLLGTPCEHPAEPVETPSTRKKRGERARYKLGDVTKQIGRDIMSIVKETVVTEAVKEHLKFGHFQMVRDIVCEVRFRWEYEAARRWALALQVASLFLVHAITYIVTLACAWPIHGQRGWRLACLQAAQSVAMVIILEGGLWLLVRFLARQAMLYSEVIEVFLKEIMYVDIYELEIDFMSAGAAAERLAIAGILWTAVLGALAAAAWLWELHAVGFGDASMLAGIAALFSDLYSHGASLVGSLHGFGVSLIEYLSALYALSLPLLALLRELTGVLFAWLIERLGELQVRSGPLVDSLGDQLSSCGASLGEAVRVLAVRGFAAASAAISGGGVSGMAS